ncbi:MAG: hypothetical protein WDZ41_05780 [Candidatus Babeliales bacterium]
MRIQFFSLILCVIMAVPLLAVSGDIRIRLVDLPVPGKPMEKEVLKDNFKYDLYRRQRALMGYKAYGAFIEPYLQKAESTQLPKYCMENNERPQCQQFFTCLLNYNVAWFHHFVASTAVASNKRIADKKKVLEDAKESLQETINQIKQDDSRLSDLNVESALNETCALFQEANKEYYKKLSAPVKFLFFMRSLFLR